MGKKPLKVLLIEDSPADARLIQELFAEQRHYSFDLVWANLLQKGLQYLEADSFDVVLLDLHLPDSYGVTIIGMVRSKAPHMPIVVLTSLNDEVRAVSAVREGAEDYIVKGQADGNMIIRSLLHAIEHRRAMMSVQKARDGLETRVQERTAELNQAVKTLQEAEKKIKDERKRFEDVLEMMPAYAILLTPDYHVAFANRTFREAFGNDNGKRCYEFLFDRREPCENCETYKVLKSGTQHFWEWTGPNNRNYDIYDYPFTDTDGSPLIMEIGVDVTAHKQAQQHIQNLNRMYRMLSEINQTIIRTGDRDQLFHEICRVAVEYGKFRMAWIGYIDPEKRMVLPVAHSGMEKDYLAKIIISIDDVPEGCGPTGRAVREGRCIVCSDIQNDPQMTPWRDEALHRGYSSSAAVPLRSKDSVVGAFTVYADQPYFFDEEERKLLEEIGMDITYALNALEEEALRKRAEDGLRESKERLGFLSSRLLSAYEEERKRISREVHDVITSSLGAILLSQKNTFNKLQKDDTGAAREAMERAIAMTQEVMRESRRIINDLRPPMLDDLGLITTIAWLARQFASIYPHIKLNQQIDVAEADVPETLKIVIFRIAQEAFTNTGKYSHAKTALLTLKKAESRLELCVSDNGIGFTVQDTVAKRDAGQGLGLVSMRERAELSGGTFAIESAAGEGTSIRAAWQVNSHQAAGRSK
jgi:signal transduction histidine kinase/DNA-binding response OmpR family regulator